MIALRCVTRTYAITLLSLLAGCSFSDKRPHCSMSSDCGAGESCYASFCVRADDSSTAGSRAGSGGHSGATATAGTAANGGTGGAAGHSSTDAGSSSSCMAGATKACKAAASSGTGNACNSGMMICQSDGTFGTCVASATPGVETCNGVDDDCDGKIDETSDESCYPNGMTGCVMLPSGAWTCMGVCNVGKKVCSNGKLSDCTGSKGPSAEVCTTTGTAADENCDGKTDENCPCTGTGTTSCYSGPVATLNVGKCRAGTQACNNGTVGACTNAVMPAPETCANEQADDDCDGIADDVAQRNNACTVPNTKGACSVGTLQCQGSGAALVCVGTIQPTTEICNGIDDDCNGVADDTFNLQTDPAHCGTCTHACTTGQLCCSGTCMTTGQCGSSTGGAGAGGAGGTGGAGGAGGAGGTAAGSGGAAGNGGAGSTAGNGGAGGTAGTAAGSGADAGAAGMSGAGGAAGDAGSGGTAGAMN